jgi:hypothetical protein
MRKHTKRKTCDPMFWINKRLPISQDQQRDLGIAYHVSLQALLSGRGTEQAWATLACALNVALILCEQGVAESYLTTIQRAQDALLLTRERAQRVNRWAFSGDEARAVMRACAIHDEQISRATRGQIVSALEEVHRRVEIGETV